MLEQQYRDRHPGSERLAARAAKVLPSGVTHDSRYLRPFNVYIERASGSRKWDVDGNEYVDYVMGHGALLMGHAHPLVIEATAERMKGGTHPGSNHDLEVRWAEAVTELVPSAEATRFTSSGTEATLMAIRIARAVTGKPTVIKFDRHFHGWHDYVVASSAYAASAPAGVPAAALDSVIVLPPQIEAVATALATHDDVAAVIVEAAGASSGAVPLPPGFNSVLARLCREHGVIFVMDEVVTGFRWSPGGVQQVENVVPDLTTLAKILAGGFPGGAVAGRRDLLQALAFSPAGERGASKVGHPGTFNANPVSAAAGVACLGMAADGTAQQKAAFRAHELRSGMNCVLRELEIPGLVYGESSVFRIALGTGGPPALDDPDPRTLPSDALEAGVGPETLRFLTLSLLNHGVQFFGSGGMTSTVHTSADIDFTVEAWRESLIEVRDEGEI